MNPRLLNTSDHALLLPDGNPGPLAGHAAARALVPAEFWHALARIRGVEATVHADLGLVPRETSDCMVRVSEDIAAGLLDEYLLAPLAETWSPDHLSRLLDRVFLGCGLRERPWTAPPAAGASAIRSAAQLAVLDDLSLRAVPSLVRLFDDLHLAALAPWPGVGASPPGMVWLNHAARISALLQTIDSLATDLFPMRLRDLPLAGIPARIYNLRCARLLGQATGLDIGVADGRTETMGALRNVHAALREASAEVDAIDRDVRARTMPAPERESGSAVSMTCLQVIGHDLSLRLATGEAGGDQYLPLALHNTLASSALLVDAITAVSSALRQNLTSN